MLLIVSIRDHFKVKLVTMFLQSVNIILVLTTQGGSAELKNLSTYIILIVSMRVDGVRGALPFIMVFCWV